MPILVCSFCKRANSNSGKLFTQKSLEQHIRDAHIVQSNFELGDPEFEMTDLVADDDMPDGAYFALAMELGEL